MAFPRRGIAWDISQPAGMDRQELPMRQALPGKFR
jgi:hypothetical protein